VPATVFHRQFAETPFYYPLLCFLFFIPTIFIFMVNKPKFVTVSTLIDTRTLPEYIANLQFFSTCAASELFRLLVLSLLSSWIPITYPLFMNIGIFTSAPISILRVWLSRVSGTYLSETDFTAYVLVSLAFTVSAPVAVTLGSWIIFKTFRGFPWYSDILFLVGYMATLTVHTDALAHFVILAMPARKSVWFVKRPTGDKRRSQYSLFGFLVYGCAGAAIVWPLMQHVVDWIFGDVTFDLNFGFIIVLGFVAFASFFGLLRSIERLKTGKASWHDDHMVAQLYAAFALVPPTVIYVFLVKKLWILDILGLAALAAPTATIVSFTFVFGTGASYLSSFWFVHEAIIRPHSEPLSDDGTVTR
jgi:hypothetical protein